MNAQEMLHYLRVGGPTLIVILLGSLFAVGVAIERMIALWNVGDAAHRLADTIGKHLLRGDVASARAAAERSDALAADVFRAGFSRLDRPNLPAGSLEGAVERERTHLGLRLKRFLWILGTIGAVTPFVGLFGTVAGIMRSFEDLGINVEAGGAGGTGAVMTGISEALVSTAAGILVAVLAVILYNYFQARISKLMTEMRLISEEFIELLREKPAPSSQTVSAQATPVATTTLAEGV
jgi:biopolymer transport protein ExbB/TolQ